MHQTEHNPTFSDLGQTVLFFLFFLNKQHIESSKKKIGLVVLVFTCICKTPFKVIVVVTSLAV